MFAADEVQFDLKFTKGNTVIEYPKLKFMQKRHAKYHNENQDEGFHTMVELITARVEETVHSEQRSDPYCV